MKRTFCALLLASALAARADGGPDDVYVRAFGLIDEATTASKANQVRAAYDKFSQAQTSLREIQKNYPNWNPSVVQLRLGLVEEALQTLRPKLPAASDAAPMKPVVPDGSSPAALGQQIQYLQAHNAALEAKLKEALSMQAGTLSIAERARLEADVTRLSKEQEVLKVSLTQEKERVAASDAKAKELELLAADGKKVRETAKAKAQLEDSVKDLGRQVAHLQDAAKADAAKSTEAMRAAEARASALQRQVDDLRGRLGDAESRLVPLVSVEAKSRSLAADKADLEKEVVRLKTAISQKPKAPERNAAVDSEIIALKAQLKLSSQAQEAEQTKVASLSKDLKSVEERATKDSAKRIKQLQDELSDSQKKRASTETKLRDATTRRKGPAADQKAVELQARLDAIEAKAVPYTREEQALFKSPTSPIIVGSMTNSAATDKKSVRRVPPGAGALVSEAERAFAARRFEEAEQKFSQALKQDDDNIYLLSNVAAAQFELGKLADSEKNIAKALKIDADDPASLTLLGILRFRQERFDEALTALSRSAQLAPNNADAQNYLGITLSQKGQRTAAEAALRRSLQLQADNPAAHYNLGVIYATQKPPFTELARFHYGKAVSLGHQKNPEFEKALDAAK